MQTVGIPKETPPADPFEGFFSTKVSYEQVTGWVCVFCQEPPKTLYLSNGDSRYDESPRMCNCREAKKIGFDRFDCEKIFNRPTTSGSYLKDGGSQFVS